MTAQLILDLSIEKYHADKSRLSKSMLSHFADCPARFRYLHLDGGDKKDTPSLRIGNAIHCRALEPELWAKKYHIMPATYINKDGEEKPFRMDTRMDAYKEQMRLAGDKTILTRDDLAKIDGMANALAKNPYALSLLKAPGYVEASIFWDGFKCRPDLLRNDGLIVDLKTAHSVRPSVFYRDAENFHYYLSVALTCRGYQALYGKMPEEYVFLCIEPEPPHLISCFNSFDVMEEMYGMSYQQIGDIELTALLERYNACKTNNVWPAYADKITPMKRPQWAMNRIGALQ